MPLAPQITNTPITITPNSFAITAVSYTSSTATYTATGHTFNPGDTVTVSDIAPAGFNGTFAISSVVASSTFTVPNTTNTAVTTATGTAYQAPTGFTLSDNTVVYVTDTTDPAGITTFYQGTAPTALEIGDIWFDTSNGNRQSRWNGTSWVLVQDTTIATALANAAAAQSAATTAYNAAIASLQPGAATIVNTSNQITAIATNGITVYAGSSPTSGARVVMNSAGLAGYNAGGTATFFVDATSGIINMSGAVITSGSITGTTLNIAGQFTVDAAGNLIANSATITGTITSSSISSSSINNGSGTFSVSAAGALVATSATITGTLYSSAGTIGGWTLSGTRLTSGSTYLDSSAGTIQTSGLISSLSAISANGNITSQAVLGGNSLTIATTAAISGVCTVSGTFKNPGITTGTYQTVTYNASNNSFYYVSSSERYKENITLIGKGDYLSSLLKLEPVFYTYKAEFSDNPTRKEFGLIAERVAQISELAPLVIFDDEGQPDSILYDRLSVYIIEGLRELNARLNKLEGK